MLGQNRLQTSFLQFISYLSTCREGRSLQELFTFSDKQTSCHVASNPWFFSLQFEARIQQHKQHWSSPGILFDDLNTCSLAEPHRRIRKKCPPQKCCPHSQAYSLLSCSTGHVSEKLGSLTSSYKTQQGRANVTARTTSCSSKLPDGLLPGENCRWRWRDPPRR